MSKKAPDTQAVANRFCFLARRPAAGLSPMYWVSNQGALFANKKFGKSGVAARRDAGRRSFFVRKWSPDHVFTMVWRICRKKHPTHKQWRIVSVFSPRRPAAGSSPMSQVFNQGTLSANKKLGKSEDAARRDAGRRMIPVRIPVRKWSGDHLLPQSENRRSIIQSTSPHRLVWQR